MNGVDLLNSSAPSSGRKSTRVGPYSIGEKQLLVELVGRARNTLRHAATQMTADQYRQIWVDISNCMHASGWPKRSWKRLRLKAQKMMSFPTEIGSLGPLLHGTLISRTDQCTNSLVSVGQGTVPSVPCVSEPVCSSILSTPPPLLSSSEASAETVMRLTSSIHSSVGVVNGGGSTVDGASGGGCDVSRPQILHFCSRALSNGICVDGFGRDTQNVNGPCVAVKSGEADGSAVIEVPNDVLLNGSNRIELCISSDDDDDGEDESDEKLSLNHSTEKDKCVDVECDVQLNSCVRSALRESSSSSSDHPAQLTKEDISKRMEIYNLKIEVLKLKRAYWTQKLRSL